MSAQDQLEIINAQGEVKFHNLNSGRGITNIGRHPDNDIVIDSSVVAPFHAILDHQQRPFRLVALNADGQVKVSGQLLQPNVPKELRNWDTIELDGTSIILMEGGAATGSQAPTIIPAPLPTPTPPLTGASLPIPILLPVPSIPASSDPMADMDELDRLLAMLPEDQTDPAIIVEPMAQTGALDPMHPNALDFSVEVEQPATMQIGIINGGDLVGEFVVEVRGIDPMWVTVSPASINLFEGQRGNVSIAITAPRLPSSTAQAHYFSVVVSSPNYPGRYTSVAGLVVIKPYYDYAVGDVNPKKQKIAWSKKVGLAVLPITNLGNAPLPVQVSGEDERHAATVEFDSPEEGIKVVNQVQFSVPSQQTQGVSVFITPRKRRFVGFGGETLQYTLTVTPMAGTEQTPRSVLGQASALPFMGPIPIILLVLLLGLLLVFFFTPRIEEYAADRTQIAAGETSTLNWRSSAFTTLKIEPGDGEPVESPVGSLTVSPTEDTTYILTAETFLTALLPQFFKDTKEISIEVEPVLPVIRVFETTGGDSVFVGDDVTVSWDVGNADTLVLSIDGADDSIAPDQHTGTRTFRVDHDTIFTLRAFNAYTPAEGLTQSVTVRAEVPTPIPPPDPLIRQFEVSPLDIVFGQDVTITWAVDGATKVNITGVEGDLPPEGSVTVRPDSDTGYVLSATNGETDITSQVQQVLVRPPATPTPAPNAPKIEAFTALPAQVGIDSPESKNVQLSWTVVGDTTDIEMIGPSGLKYNGLPKQGSLRVVVDKASLYVLTAYNGTSLFSSSTTQVKVVNPVPKIDSIAPNSSIEVGGNGVNITVTGSGFTRESKVRWAGSNRATAYVSPTQLTATILAEDFIAAGTFEVNVFNPTPGGGTSGAATFTLNNPAPTLDSISPSEVFFGTSDTTLNVFGTSFVKNSVVRFGGVDLTTTYVSTTQLSARIPASQLNTAGSKPVLVFNPTPGGGTSSSLGFNVFSELLTPSITLISPSAEYAGSDGLVLTVTGASFTPSSTVRWKGVSLSTTYIDENHLNATIDASLIASTGVANVTVANPPPVGAETVLSQVTSNARTFNITAVQLDFVDPSDTLVPISSSAVVGGFRRNMYVRLGAPLAADTVITLNSSNTNRLKLTAGACPTLPTPPVSQITFNGLSSIASVTATAGDVLIPFCLNASPTTGNPAPVVTARLGSTLGGDQSSLTVAVNSSAPTINTLTPNGTGIGSSSFSLAINGTGFGVDKTKVKVKWPGQADLTPTSVIDTQIKVVVPSTYLTNPGPLSINVDVDGQASNSAVFTIGTPSLTSISPTTKIAGQAGFTLTLNGIDFVSGATVVVWEAGDCSTGAPAVPLATYTTNYLSSTQLTTFIPASIIANNLNGATDTSVKCFAVKNPAGNGTAGQSIVVSGFTTTLPATASVNLGATQVLTLGYGTTQQVSRTINLSSTSTDVTFRAFSGSCGGSNVTSVTSAAGVAAITFCVYGNAVSAALPATSSTATITVDVAGVAESGGVETAVVTVNKLAPTLSIVPTPSSSNAGDSVSFSVTITGTGADPIVSSTNNIQIKDGASTICTIISVNSSGVGTCSGEVNSIGSVTLTAAYTGDTLYAPATQNFFYTVSAAATTVFLSDNSDGTTVYGEPFILSGRVNSGLAGTLDGEVDFRSGIAAPFDEVYIGTAAGTTVTTTVSTEFNASTTAYSFSARYDAIGGNYADSAYSSPAISHTISRANTTIAIVKTSPGGNPVTGQSVTLSATVSAVSPSTATPTGTVAFRLGSASGTDISGCAGVSLVAGVATCATTFNAASSPVVVFAVYGQTTNFESATPTSVSVTVDKATPTVTITKTTPSGNPVTGQSFTLQATITPPHAGSIAPTGTITWTGIAGCSTGSTCTDDLTAGTYSVTAAYAGDANYNTATSPAFSLTVDKGNVTVTLTKSSPAGNPVTGETITFSAIVAATSPAVGTPTGSVTVASGSTLCTITLSSGTGTCTTALNASASPYTVTGSYGGDSNFNTGSGSLAVTVDKANTTLIISSDLPDPSVVNVAYTVIVTLSVNPPGAGTLTGTISVDGGASGGTCTITLPAVSCTLTPTTAGAKTITATYNGDTNFNLDAAPSVAHQVN